VVRGGEIFVASAAGLQDALWIAGGVPAAVPGVFLLCEVEPVRNHDMQVVARPRQRHIEQPALLVDLRAAAVRRSEGMQPSTARST
jgi:hypothetical protein